MSQRELEAILAKLVQLRNVGAIPTPIIQELANFKVSYFYLTDGSSFLPSGMEGKLKLMLTLLKQLIEITNNII